MGITKGRPRGWSALALGALVSWSSQVSALQPPEPGERRELGASGELPARLEAAARLGNHRTDPRLLWNFKRSRMRAAGMGDAQIAAEIGNTPPPDWRGGLPATGTPKIFVMLVDFPDYPHGSNHTQSDVQSKFFGQGDASKAPYESLRNYYQRASYNQLSIQGTVLNWYRAQNSRSYYQGLGFGAGQEVLMKEAITYYNNLGHDFAQYDNDNDGTIDAFFIKWTGPDNGWAGFWWAYQWEWHVDTSFRVDGKRLGKYVWSWVARPTTDSYQAHVDIHETGHLLGLPDLYDYDGGQGPDGGVGDLDMMDANWGDHNCFSKYMLGWLTPTVIANGTQVRQLGPSGTTKDCVLIMPGATPSTMFGEFFMAQYRKRGTGNDPAGYPTDGMLIWHIDSTLDATGTDFLFNNSYTAHKYVRLMEADGLEEIEQGLIADMGDFYLPPKTFSKDTVPNSRKYAGQSTGVTIDEIGTPGETLSAQFKVALGADITLAGSTLTAESCGTGNGAIDPFETVTLQIALRNVGLASTTNLKATLLASAGVTSPSGQQTYGVLTVGGTAISKPFTFTAVGTCGGTITLSLQLTDGAAQLGVLNVNYALGKPVIGLEEDFDGVVAPSLPLGWTATVAQGSVAKWATRMGTFDSPSNSVYSAAPATVTDNQLVSPPMLVTSTAPKLRFRHKYDLEEYYDGGVLEISVGGGSYMDILDAGGEFESGGYTRSISQNYSNPLAGRQAWSGTTSGFVPVKVTLPPGLLGRLVRFRWRVGTDTMESASGWYVDSIVFEDGITCCDPSSIIVDRNSTNVPEGGTAIFQVKLASPPTGDKVVTVSKTAGGDADLTIESGASLTFNAGNYDVYQTVTIAAAEDGDALDGQAVFVCQSAQLHDAPVVAMEDDNDLYEIRVIPEVVHVPESGTASLQVRLGAAPPSNVVVMVGILSGDSDITVQSGSSLTFTPSNFDKYQTVTLAAAEDPDAIDGQVSIKLEATGWPARVIDAIEDDNDTFSLEVSATSLSIGEGGLATFQARLTAAPPNPTTISVKRVSGDSSIVVKSGASLRFGAGNYNIWQTVTLAAENDADAANGDATIRCAGVGVQPKELAISEVDDDTLEIVLDTASISVTEGLTAGFPVRLGAQPLEDVLVTVMLSGDPDLTILAGGTLKFTPGDWNLLKTVTLQAAQDDDIAAGEAVVRCSAPGLDEKTLLAVERDNDALAIIASTAAISVGEMQTASFTVKLAAKPNGAVPVTVKVIPGDPDITLQSAAMLEFEPATWNIPQPVIVAAARDLDTTNGESKIRMGGPGLELVDIAVTELDDGIEPPTWYADSDGDGFGNPGLSMRAWTQPAGYTADSSDCDDAQASVYPGAVEVCDNSVDDNCSGAVDEGCYVPPPPPADSDADGVTDDVDACPNTPAGTAVGTDGCPPPPPVDTDADDDGVADDLDACPNTPAGMTVAANGCPPPPPVNTDADGDGVPDAADQCPDTPDGTTVDASGCTVQTNPPVDDDQDAGQQTPDLDDDTPPVTPPCGMGLAESLVGMVLGLALIQRRRA